MNNVIELSRGRSSARALVAAEVRAEIARAGTSQLAVAKATGISQSTLNRKLSIKAAERDVFDVSELQAIANALSVPIAKFFTTVDDRPDGGGTSRPRESNSRPSHYRAPVVALNRTLSRGVPVRPPGLRPRELEIA